MKRTASLVAAWLPMFAIWVTFSLQMGETLRRAIPRGLLAIGAAALLGLAVPPICARVRWAGELRLRFYGIHLIAAALYATAWMSVMAASGAFLERTRLPRGLIVGWLVEGVWLYALVAGITYAIQGERRAVQAEASLAAARLDALRSRLQPHFLFNALHTVGALVRHDPAEAENAIEKLGDMLRYTLRDDGGEVSFAEEWELTRRYLEFEQLRYGQRLRVVTDIDPRSLACSAPPFALQTLVENSVRHSIDRRAEGGRVEITARTNGNMLHIRVKDDGVEVEDRRPRLSDSSGYGLDALRQRLDAAYGAPLNIVRDDSGFEVSFAIPCGHE